VSLRVDAFPNRHSAVFSVPQYTEFVGNFADTYQEINVSRTPNDDRSDSMNPNNDAYETS
jgi:hypothetical protein